jgi:hypothetical protein
MTYRLDNLEARMIAMEMFIRAILTGMVARAADPIGEIERMADEFKSSIGFMRVEGAPEDHAEKMLALIRARADENFDAIRARMLRDIEVQAAQAGRKN